MKLYLEIKELSRKGDRQFKLPVSFKRESKLGYMDKKHGG